MDVGFASRRLEESFRSETEAVRRWGSNVARKYIERVNILLSAEEFRDLFSFQALRLHPLKGERSGQWAMTLHGRWRLIIAREGEKGILVKEVTNHYDD